MNGLVVAGGLSSRMGQDKASLIFHGESMRVHAQRALRTTCDQVFLSLRKDSPLLQNDSLSPGDLILLDQIPNIGPAAALLRAYTEAPTQNWMVVACDFPFVSEAAAALLVRAHQLVPTEVTCFENGQAMIEPLFAIWTPLALRRLKQNVARGRLGPIQTILSGPHQKVAPTSPAWLTNTNTPSEFRRALEL